MYMYNQLSCIIVFDEVLHIQYTSISDLESSTGHCFKSEKSDEADTSTVHKHNNISIMV